MYDRYERMRREKGRKRNLKKKKEKEKLKAPHPLISLGTDEKGNTEYHQLLWAIKDPESSAANTQTLPVPVEVPSARCTETMGSSEIPGGNKSGIKQSSMSNNLAQLLLGHKHICLPTNVQQGMRKQSSSLLLVFDVCKP